MIIGVAGPYSSSDEEQRRKNLRALNDAAAILLKMGHIPLIGINAALPVMESAALPYSNTAVMEISMAVINACDALLLIAESPGANRERDLILSKGLPVFYSFSEIPEK